jgi:hypothetical protein
MGCLLLLLPKVRISQRSTKITFVTNLTVATLSLRQADHARTDFAGIESDAQFIMEQVAWPRTIITDKAGHTEASEALGHAG